MATFTIRDETVHAAFDTLEAHAQPAAAAKAMRERREDQRKAAKASAFLKASGSVAEREATAVLSEEYRIASEGYYAAVGAGLKAGEDKLKSISDREVMQSPMAGG
jgi:hypothetical protein